MFNHQGECGTGAIVPWADRLWVITYAPHKPAGSDDKLYEIDANLSRVTRPESVGGTPADRMIHRESDQLIIGPYLIDSKRAVRVVSPQQMPGRLTAVARHLSDPPARQGCSLRLSSGLLGTLDSISLRFGLQCHGPVGV